MNAKTKVLGIALAVAALAGCDPYQEGGSIGGAPRLLRAAAFHVATESVVAEATDNTVVLDGVDVLTDAIPDDPATPEDDSAPPDPRLNAIQLQFSSFLDGKSVQAAAPLADGTPGDCTPVGLTVTPAAPAGSKWFTCYDPASGADDARGSVIVYRHALPTSAPDDETDIEDLSTAELDPNVTYLITGTVRASGGQEIPVNVTVNTVDTPD